MIHWLKLPRNGFAPTPAECLFKKRKYPAPFKTFIISVEREARESTRRLFETLNIPFCLFCGTAASICNPIFATMIANGRLMMLGVSGGGGANTLPYFLLGVQPIHPSSLQRGNRTAQTSSRPFTYREAACLFHP